MSFERVGVLSQLIRNTTKKWIAKINFWGHKGMYQGLCCFCWQVLSYIRELCYFNWRRLIYRMSLHALPISWQWRVSNTASMIFRAVFDGLITASPTVTGGNRWGAIMIFCIENQKLCLRSVQFKKVLRHPPVDISYAGLKFDPCFCQFQFNDDLKIKTQGQTRTSNPDLSYPNFSPFPLDYLTYTHWQTVFLNFYQWRIYGRGLGVRPLLIFRPNWGPKGRKKFFGDRMTGSPLISRSGSGTGYISNTWPWPFP